LVVVHGIGSHLQFLFWVFVTNFAQHTFVEDIILQMS